MSLLHVGDQRGSVDQQSGVDQEGQSIDDAFDQVPVDIYVSKKQPIRSFVKRVEAKLKAQEREAYATQYEAKNNGNNATTTTTTTTTTAKRKGLLLLTKTKQTGATTTRKSQNSVVIAGSGACIPQAVWVAQDCLALMPHAQILRTHTGTVENLPNNLGLTDDFDLCPDTEHGINKRVSGIKSVSGIKIEIGYNNCALS
jgi:hypothetical protein